MNDGRLREFYERIQDAEMVLVGLGEDFQYDWNALTEDERYREIEEEIGDNEEKIWIVPFLQRMILQQSRDDRWNRAYKNLRDMLAEKNYFIISLCMDDYIYGAGFEESRIVTPCGGFRKMQCDNHCDSALYEVPQDSYNAVLQYYRKELSIDDLQEPVCKQCGSKLRFNQLGVMRYAEEGYLERWNEYTKWLQGTVNKRLCVIELGVGMEYPTVIRFPFEKIVFYNQKAFLYRIHPMLCQIGEEIGDRGCAVKEDPVAFLKHLETAIT